MQYLKSLKLLLSWTSRSLHVRLCTGWMHVSLDIQNFIFMLEILLLYKALSTSWGTKEAENVFSCIPGGLINSSVEWVKWCILWLHLSELVADGCISFKQWVKNRFLRNLFTWGWDGNGLWPWPGPAGPATLEVEVKLYKLGNFGH